MPTPRRTDAQCVEAIELVERFGNVSAAARESGVNRRTLSDRYHEGLARGLGVDGAVRTGMDKLGSEYEPELMWVKTKEPSGEDGRSVSYSALYKKKRDVDATADDLRERIAAVFESIEPIPEVPRPDPELLRDDILNVIPAPDAHIGALAWGEETGLDNDINLSVRRLTDSVSELVTSMPSASECAILYNGDTLHANDQTNQTPANRHVLDVDTRHRKTIERAIEGIAVTAETAALVNDVVRIVVKPGNHDPEAYLAVLFGLMNRYRNNPRIIVDDSKGEFWLCQFGKVMIFTHHGHRAKPEALVMAMANEHPKVWGDTEHRFVFTAHKHSRQSQRIGGAMWFQSSSVTVRDAYAAGGGWPDDSGMDGYVFHKEQGLKQTHRVNIGA